MLLMTTKRIKVILYLIMGGDMRYVTSIYAFLWHIKMATQKSFQIYIQNICNKDSHCNFKSASQRLLRNTGNFQGLFA